MSLPYDASRLAAIKDFATWKTALEKMLASLDDRIVARGSGAGFARVASFSTIPYAPETRAGEGVLWLGADLPPGLLPCDGSTVSTETYADLYAALGDLYATGDEPEGEFRLPALPAPPSGVYAVRA